jgi:filamentous hemagglutinin family protein
MRSPGLLAAAVAAAFALPASAQVASTTLPTGAQHGTGISVATSGAEMTVTQSSAREVINWQSFSIGSGAHVRFQQPGASSVVLNRVVGNNPSEIFGRLTANGQVFLANPSGVLFAPGASVEVGSLVATTLSISDQDFLAGIYRFQNSGGAGSVVNKGSIVTPSGYAALAGPQVRNEGVIIAQLGAVALAAGDRVTMDMVGDGLINVSVDQAALNASIVNTGTIQADGGRVLMTARTANTLLDTVINNDGLIRANRLAERDGHIVLDAGPNGLVGGNGTYEASGTINVNMGETPGPVIPPIIVPQLPPPGTLPLLQGGSFNVGSTGSVTLSGAGSLTLDNVNRVALTNATLSPMEMTGSITLNTFITGTSIGPIAPMQHSIIGTGVTLPSEGK